LEGNNICVHAALLVACGGIVQFYLRRFFVVVKIEVPTGNRPDKKEHQDKEYQDSPIYELFGVVVKIIS
jgi:hypothetical protein